LEERGSIEKLDISSLGLQGKLDLKGFTNLKSLDCSDNELTSINLSGCSKLEYLDCSCNKLKQLELKETPQLQELYAHNNLLFKRLNFDITTNLHTLIISKNKLSGKLDARKLVNLRKLDCSSNLLAGLDLSNNLNLKTLLCYENNFRSLEVSHLEKLKYLYCYHNILDELDVGGLKNLKELYCANNLRSSEIQRIGLNKLCVKGCEKIKVLDCAENCLVELDISNLPALEFFSAKENSLDRLDATNCPELNYLDISKQIFNDGMVLTQKEVKKVSLVGTNNIKEVFFEAFMEDSDDSLIN